MSYCEQFYLWILDLLKGKVSCKVRVRGAKESVGSITLMQRILSFLNDVNCLDFRFCRRNLHTIKNN